MHRFILPREQTSLALAILTALIAGFPSASLSQSSGQQEVVVVGSFSNMRFTEEHACGYTVELWRHRGTLVGLLLVAEGLQGDTPAGILEKVEFEEKTGAFRFEAKLSTGALYNKEHDGVPSRDLFRFRGTLKKNQLRGRMEQFDGFAAEAQPAAEQVVLRREASASGMTVYKTMAEWKEDIDAILKFRGPKW